MSSTLLFHRHFLRSSVNIPTGLAPERQCRLPFVDRPWASGLHRLLAERRMKKQDLADLAGVRPGTISAVVNSPRPPEIPTLQRLAEGFTKYDRQANPRAPEVPMWHFFVTDEQAALLTASASKHQELVKQDQLVDRVMERLAPMVATVLHDVVNGTPEQAPATSKRKQSA